LDLVVVNTGTGVPNELFINDGGTFTSSIDAAFIFLGGTAVQVSFADIE
jgi:hypothetical protein